MRDSVDTAMCWTMGLILSVVAAGLVGAEVSLVAAVPTAMLCLLFAVVLMLKWDKNKQLQLFKLMVADPTEVRVQARLHELAKDTQAKFDANEKIQRRPVSELDATPDEELLHERRKANNAANAAKENFWSLHNYLTKYMGYAFPYTKIGQFAANDPAETPWPTSEEVRKENRKKGSAATQQSTAATAAL